MDEEIKRKWVEALRSGQFLQGQNALSSVGREGLVLCCIGVGFCVARPTENVGAYGTTGAARAIGLSRDQESHLVIMNDEEGASFAQIADYIEANL